MAQQYKVRSGGLMRCCEATLSTAMAIAEVAPQEGDVLACKYCSSTMRFRDGAWEWNRPADA